MRPSSDRFRPPPDRAPDQRPHKTDERTPRDRHAPKERPAYADQSWDEENAMNIATGLSGLHAASARMDRAAATIARSAATPVSITAKAAATEQRPSEPVGKPASETPSGSSHRTRPGR